MIIVLVGFMGSGKSTVGKHLAKDLNFNFLEISDVVKSILTKGSRSQMVGESLEKKQEDPMWLANPIRDKILKKKNWVISGVREIVLIDMLRDLGQPVYVVHLTCNDKIRLKRCKDKHKTLEALYQADEVDNNLGLNEVLNNADTSVSTSGPPRQARLMLLDLLETFSTGLDLDES